jgi:hypothetical protein
MNLAMARREALWFMPGEEKMTLSRFFSFPNPINDADTRVHAFCILCLVAAGVALDYYNLLTYPFLHYYVVLGYFLRVLTGPKLDPQAFIVLFLLKPFFQKIFCSFPNDDFHAGPPKRFAQTIGFCTASTATVLGYFGLTLASYSVWGFLGFLCALQFTTGFCLGCFIFGILMKAGLIPKETCNKCNNYFVISRKSGASINGSTSRIKGLRNQGGSMVNLGDSNLKAGGSKSNISQNKKETSINMGE